MESKKGVIALVVALVAIVGAAGAGYTLLGKQASVVPDITLSSQRVASSASSGLEAAAQDTETSQPGEASNSSDTQELSSATNTSNSPEAVDASDATGASDAATDATNTSEAGPITLPAFSVQDRQGNTVPLSNVYGKPALVGFWATWCPPCNAEAPALQKLYETYGDRINFMMIDAGGDGRDTADVVEDWIAEGGYTYPIYLDPLGTASTAAQIYYLPTTFVLDAEGNVLTAFSGALDEESGTELMEQLLEYAAS